jgi:hypothetical protein
MGFRCNSLALSVAVSFSFAMANAWGSSTQFDGVELDSGVRLLPSLYTGLGHENNIALTRDDEIDSFFWQVSPSLDIFLNPGDVLHEFSFSGDIARYSSSQADDYEDFSLKYSGLWEPTSRHRLNLEIVQSFAHQKRGSQQTRFQLDRFDEVLQFKSNNSFVAYEFGSEVARAQLGASLGYGSTDYTNFESFTSQFDLENYNLATWFHYRPGKVTSLSFDLTHNKVRYKNDLQGLFSRNANVTTVLVGAIWDGLAKTTGKFKVGAEDRRFDSSLRDNITSFVIDAEVVWTPKTYSEVTLSASRRTIEGVGNNDATLSTSFNANWSHSWSENLTTRLGYDFQQRDEKGTSELFVSRQDDQHYVYVEISRFLSKWVVLSSQLKLLTNKSNQTLFEYDNQQLSIGVTVGL